MANEEEKIAVYISLIFFSLNPVLLFNLLYQQKNEQRVGNGLISMVSPHFLASLWPGTKGSTIPMKYMMKMLKNQFLCGNI